MDLPDNPQIVVAKTNELVDLILQRWQALWSAAVQRRGYFAVAVSGGRGPIGFYQHLARFKNQEFWNKTHLFLVDERYVPLNHDDSNFHMINQTLLIPGQIPEANVHPILTHHLDPEESAWEYEDGLKSFFHLKTTEFPVFDLIMLGVGHDGHTASLFPETPQLRETERLVVSSQPPPEMKHRRITLTLPVINQARSVIVHVPGAEKCSILKKILIEKSPLPINLVKPQGGMIFYLDQSSGGFLKPKKSSTLDISLPLK